jgi:hypothetical protein
MPLKVPDDDGVSENVTVPVGVMSVPRLVSATVAVQVVAWLTATVDGEQATAVEVLLGVAVNEKVLELLGWSVSPP